MTSTSIMNQRDIHLPPDVMADVQASADTRRLAIDRVGIRALRHPVRVRGADGSVQHTIATFSLAVRLDHDVKGTHMSRFVELLENDLDVIDGPAFSVLLANMVARLNAREGEIKVSFPYFIEKTAPVSGVKSLLDYEVAFQGVIKEGAATVVTEITAPVTSLCPCSKEISAYGAHNQRSHIRIAVRGTKDNVFNVEEIIRIAEDQASSELYGILKRTDEKFVTERAYDNPKFVEDLVRDIAAHLNADARVEAYTVESENFESIHNHSAFAVIEHDKTRSTTR
jgi:GTP cyclohydrolase IB